ncbi:MAG: response regulator [Succiniclasticum sp.]|uniref:nucleotide-binding protein n=1 Tax=Succiniclasticum sp. TaxID=2775030 RepID=UPI002A91753F|nr:response regulator [Succiniclasticum sp.]MDY6290801.1 response regulator [Succiniclasticum sp.]
MEYRVILVESNRLMLERLSSVIRNTKDFELVSRYQQAGDALGQGLVFKPNLILLDIDDEENLSMLEDFTKSFSDADVICLSAKWAPSDSESIARAGAKGFLIKPFTSEELIEALRTFNKSGLSYGSDVISFFSPKGKSGKTTLIANLGMALAQKTGQQVGVIDADLQFGDMSVFFNLAPKTTIMEAVRDINFLSPVTLNSYFLPIAENLRVLCGTRRPEYAEMVDIKAFTEVIDMARSMYRYVLIDLPSGFVPISIATAEASDITYLAAMINGTFEIHHMQRALEIFKAWPDYENRVRTVFTRVEPCNNDEREKLAQSLGYNKVSVIPNEYMLVSSAANNGQMAILEQPSSKFANFVNQLADEIIGSRAHVRLG